MVVLGHADMGSPATKFFPEGLIISRASDLQTLQAKPLSAEHQAALGLPVYPFNLERQTTPSVHACRKLDWLAPHRAPWYPDDVQFLLPPPAIVLEESFLQFSPKFQSELVWVRVVRLSPDGRIECTMLTELDSLHRLPKGTRVLVASYERGGLQGLCYSGRAE